MDRDDPSYRGQSDYNRLLLALYDPIVAGPVTRFVWRCPADRLVERYQRHIRPRHLDIGPGTGYFLRKSRLDDGAQVTILDPNTTVLRHVARRLAPLPVTAVEADVCKPLPIEGPFDSVALHMVIHCLRGPWERKAGAIANAARVLASDGVLFGASVLGASGPHAGLARRVLRVFNGQGGFDNLEDSEEAIERMLRASFDDVEIEIIGSVATFAARGPRVRPWSTMAEW